VIPIRAPVDIQGRRFGRLTALHPTDRRDAKGYVLWHCRCDCGNETDISYNNLMYTAIVSCGCRKAEHSATLREHLTWVSDTNVNILSSKKTPKNNTTGYKGVYFVRGKYLAKIHFQKKQYYLGAFDNISDAVRARRDAEAQLFDQTAEFYEKWKQKAKTSPQWAAENPINIQVHQNEDHSFSVLYYPVF